MKQKLYLIMNNNYFPYALIGLTIVLFNLIAVFGLNVLLLDDNARYLSVVQDEFPIHILYRSFLGAVFFEWYAYKIMFYSPELIRFLYVIVYMIPVSWVVYRITNHHLGISKNVSITLSILPNIIPKQLFIPAFINGSYPVYGLLITLIAFLLGLQYLKNENKRSYVYLIISVIVFYIAGLTFAEYIVFLFPPLVFFILFYGSNMKKKILLSLLYLPIVLLKIYLTLFGFKAGANQPIQLSLNEILNRIYLYFEWAVPFSIEKIFFPFLIILICIIGAGFIHLFYKGSSIKRPQLFNNLSDKSFYCYVYAFGFLWTISTSFVFVFLSPFYSARYLYVSYIGLFFIVIISLGELLNFNLIKKIKAGSVFFLCLILFFGISRYSYLKQTYRIHNSSREKIISQTKIGKMPLNSQIVIVDFGTTGGWWIWSTGYIQYITKRNDLTGIIGPARSFYNPMKPWKKFYDPDSIMNGLELGKPIFLFKYDRKTGFLNSYKYALQWLENHRNSEWIIYEFSPASGKNVIKEKGVGFNEYIKKVFLSSGSGIKKEEVLWGSSLDSNVIQSFNLTRKEIEYFDK